MCLPHNVPPAEANNVCPIEPFSILIYVHVTYWVLHLLGDQILKQAHKDKRLQGYTEFYLETVRLTNNNPGYVFTFHMTCVVTVVSCNSSVLICISSTLIQSLT